TGSVLILFDIPLTLMIPILLIVGFLILLILGAVTVAEIKTALESLKPANLKKIGIFKKLDGIKFFEKSTPVTKDKAQPAKGAAAQPVKRPDKKSGIGLHLTSFISSIKSLGTVIKERSKRGKKIEDINRQLDRTVTEKIDKRSALESAGNIAGTSGSHPSGGAGTTSPASVKEQDPFLSLSDDEFDAGLLDDLDSPVSTAGISDGSASSLSDTNSLDINEPDIPLPSLDMDGEAGNILRENNAEGLEEFSGLDGGDSIDSDFGDLDGLSLDDVELDDDENPSQSHATTAAPEPVNEVAPPEPGKDPMKTEWIKSDAPKNAGQFEDDISTQSDMASFSGGAGSSDADLLSSLASDVKHVKVEKNLSLLRDLKDFKAPGTEIETELNEVFARMNAIQKTDKNKIPPPEGIK
ncbi:MAG: hypothetical protein Q7T80_18740, partial [Methanoregula sp.]|nr:hypothetical protein [Methanoregula sp.]